MPAGRVIDFTPMPGAAGWININDVFTNLTKWEPKIKADLIDISNFNSPVGSSVAIHREWLAGPIDGEFVITGIRDRSLVGWNPMPNDTGQAFLNYDVDFGFTIEFIVSDIGGGQDSTKAGEFSCTIKANGLITFNGTNNLAG